MWEKLRFSFPEPSPAMSMSVPNVATILKKTNLQAISPKQGSLLIISILVLMGGIAWFTVSDKEEYLIQRNFRVLNLWSQETLDKIDSYKKGFKFASAGISKNGNVHFHGPHAEKDVSKENRNRTLITPHQQTDEHLHNDPQRGMLSDMEEVSKAGPAFINPPKKPRVEDGFDSISIDCILPDTQSPTRYSSLKKRFCTFEGVTDLAISPHQTKKSNLSLKDTPLGSPSIQITYINDENQVDITGNVDLKNFLNRLTKESPFEEVLVFQSTKDSQAPKIFQAGSHGFSWSNLSHITKRSKPSFLISNIFNSEQDSTDAETSPSIQQGPHHYLIEVPGDTYDVFSYPFTVDSEEQIKWVIMGLVSHNAFQRSYLTISSTILLVMILLVLALVLGIPLFHLQMMGPTDPLQSAHVLASALSALLGAALLTYLSLDLVHYGQVKQTLEVQMEKSADAMRRGLKDELKRILHTIRSFDKSDQFNDDFKTLQSHSPTPVGQQIALWKDSLKNPCIGLAKNEADLCYSKFVYESFQLWTTIPVGQRMVLLEEGLKDPCVGLAKNKADLCYSNFIYAFWMDNDASIRVNWARKGNKGVDENISLKDRNYAKAVLKHSRDLWRYPNPKTPDMLEPPDALEKPDTPKESDYQFFLEPITSWNTGKHTVVASMRSNRGSMDHPWVAAMEFTFSSLMNDVVLPPGIGFAVLDNSNHRVLFHSEEDRNRGENFLVETDHDATLRDLLVAKTAGHTDGSYWGKSTSFYVLPLDHIPWSLVVYRDKSILRSINLVGILVAGTLYGLWSFILYFVTWLLLKRLTFRQKACWLWPTRTHHLSYSRLLKFNCTLFVLGAIVLYRFSGSPTQQLTWGLGLLPIVGLFGAIAIFQQKKGSESDDDSFRKSYAYSASSLLLIFAILPAFACYSSVNHLEMRLFTQFQLLEIFKGLQNSDKLQYVEQIEACPTFSDSHTKNILVVKPHCRPSGVYPDFFTDTFSTIRQETHTLANNTSSQLDAFFSLLSQPFLPLLKHTSLGGFMIEAWPEQSSKNKQSSVQRKIRWEHDSNSTWLWFAPPDGKLPQSSTSSETENVTKASSNDEHPPVRLHGLHAHHPFLLSWPISTATPVYQMVGYCLIGFIFAAWLIKIPKFIANRTVFLSYPTQSRFPMQTMFLCQNFVQPNNRLILGFPGQGKTPMVSDLNRNHSCFIHFDLKTLPPNQWWAILSSKLEKAKKDNVQHVHLVVDHLEYQWKNPAYNIEKLKFLELLLHRHTSTLRTESTKKNKTKKSGIHSPQDTTT